MLFWFGEEDFRKTETKRNNSFFANEIRNIFKISTMDRKMSGECKKFFQKHWLEIIRKSSSQVKWLFYEWTVCYHGNVLSECAIYCVLHSSIHIVCIRIDKLPKEPLQPSSGREATLPFHPSVVDVMSPMSDWMGMMIQCLYH